MEEREVAIAVKDVRKIYKLYDKPKDRLKEAFGFRKKQTYTLHYALNGVSLNIYKGETVGIIGTNGSGKSTILKIITGVLNPTDGEVSVNGRISALLELGAGFNMEYNGIENVYLNGTMMGFSDKEIEAKLPDILEFADIGNYVNQPVKTYSSGMFVRLAFAVAINIEPEILIVDEALSVGDVFFQAKCYHKFEEFKKQGKTIVFVSHDLSSISKYCDRVFLLNKGTLLGTGTAKEMIDVFKRVLVGQYEVPAKEPLPDGEGKAAVRSGQAQVFGSGTTTQTAESGGAGKAAGVSESGGRSAGVCGSGGADGTAGTPEPGRGGGMTGVCGSNGAGGTEGVSESGRGGGMTGVCGSNGAGGTEGVSGAGTTGENSGALEYGTGQAGIVEYYLTDDRGIHTRAVIKGSLFTLHMKVEIHEHIPAPIFAFSFKNAIGTEITGTNTMIEKAFLESAEPGQVKEITFTQKMSLQGGEYLLSLGVTGYEGDEFKVYHRLYDVLDVMVVSDKDTVGYYDMDSVVKVVDCGEKGEG